MAALSTWWMVGWVVGAVVVALVAILLLTITALARRVDGTALGLGDRPRLDRHQDRTAAQRGGDEHRRADDHRLSAHRARGCAGLRPLQHVSGLEATGMTALAIIGLVVGLRRPPRRDQAAQRHADAAARSPRGRAEREDRADARARRPGYRPAGPDAAARRFRARRSRSLTSRLCACRGPQRLPAGVCGFRRARRRGHHRRSAAPPRAKPVPPAWKRYSSR